MTTFEDWDDGTVNHAAEREAKDDFIKQQATEIAYLKAVVRAAQAVAQYWELPEWNTWPPPRSALHVMDGLVEQLRVVLETAKAPRSDD
jgi:hypothetical protein